MANPILEVLYNELCKSESIIRDFNDLKKGYIEKWVVDTEIQVNDFHIEICLCLYFKESFPLSIPKIYVDQESYDCLKYIPHIENNKSICIFDEDTLILDQNDPLGIVLFCLRRAKKIIQDGLEGNNKTDFRKEIKAYWIQQYENEQKVISISYLSLLNKYPSITSVIKLYKINPEYRVFKYILMDDETSSILFRDFLNAKGYKLTEQNALFLSDFNLEEVPPYSLKNRDLLEKISIQSMPFFENYIKSDVPVNKHVFFINGTQVLGWAHNWLNINRNGFRPGKIDNWKAFTVFQKNDYVNRVYVNTYNNKRIENRTAGIIQPKFNFLIAGLGSIGSNLIFFLNAMNYPDYSLIDDDYLTIENIGRHLLGIDNVNAPKIDGIKRYINNIRPDQKVEVKKAKLETVLMHDIQFINNNDYAFIAIGNQNIENFLLKLINTGEITIPVFILWVEPYLIGGHCLYINPENKISENSIFDNFFYLYNVISPDEYQKENPLLTKNEAGCQTSYAPYSENDLILFLSGIYKEINDIIKTNSNRSMAIRWVGNTTIADGLGILLNDDINKEKPYNYQIIDL